MTSRRLRDDLNKRMGPAELAIFREVVQDLRRLAPPPLPVSVRRTAPPQAELADSELRKRRGKWGYRIRVHPDAGIHLALYLLWHEWSHCLGWAEGHPTVTDHDEVWGVCLSRAYRAIHPEDPPESHDSE